EALETALVSHAQDTQVSVILFGTPPQRPTEIAQLDALTAIAAAHPNFRLYPVRLAKDIARTIRDAFPKASLELRAADATSAIQPLLFNQPISVRDWPADGLLRREPTREIVRLKAPGESRTTDKELDVLGGERAILQ